MNLIIIGIGYMKIITYIIDFEVLSLIVCTKQLMLLITFHATGRRKTI